MTLFKIYLTILLSVLTRKQTVKKGKK